MSGFEVKGPMREKLLKEYYDTMEDFLPEGH